MMIVQLSNGNKYLVRFYTDWIDVDYADLKTRIRRNTKRIVLDVVEKTRKVAHTQACICYLLPDTVEGGKVLRREEICIGSGIAKQSPLDTYNKRVGKKIALARALENAEARICGLGLYPDLLDTPMDKRIRKVFWDKFLEVYKRWF
jgi:hypothetical protein